MANENDFDDFDWGDNFTQDAIYPVLSLWVCKTFRRRILSFDMLADIRGDCLTLDGICGAVLIADKTPIAAFRNGRCFYVIPQPDSLTKYGIWFDVIDKTEQAGFREGDFVEIEAQRIVYSQDFDFLRKRVELDYGNNESFFTGKELGDKIWLARNYLRTTLKELGILSKSRYNYMFRSEIIGVEELEQTRLESGGYDVESICLENEMRRRLLRKPYHSLRRGKSQADKDGRTTD